MFTFNLRNLSVLKFMAKLYSDNVNISMLSTLMENLQVLLKDGDYLCFDDIIASSRCSVSQGAAQKKKCAEK